LLDLLSLWLERRPFGAPVAFIQLIASQIGPANQAQLSLLRVREEQALAARSQAIARLSAAFGSEAVLKPTLRNTYRPEGRIEWVPALDALELKPVEPGVGLGSRFAFAPLTLALRQLSPPERVVLRPGPTIQRAGQSPKRIVGVDGPQRLSGEWWAQGFDRSYSWLRLESGELYWVFREKTGQVFLQAVGD
jgi:hypothetical protein